MVPEVRPVTAEVTVADDVVEVVEAVGFEIQVSAPEALVTPLVAKQNRIEVVAPLAVTDPFKVTEVAPIEVGSLVVATGGPAAIVKVKFLLAVALTESVTLKVSGVADAVAVGVPEITPVVVLRVSPVGKLPDVRAQALYVPEPPVAVRERE